MENEGMQLVLLFATLLAPVVAAIVQVVKLTVTLPTTNYQF
ncbi:hypothetical protein [Peribacillus simplex]